jgi:hypothetical protein
MEGGFRSLSAPDSSEDGQIGIAFRVPLWVGTGRGWLCSGPAAGVCRFFAREEERRNRRGGEVVLMIIAIAMSSYSVGSNAEQRIDFQFPDIPGSAKEKGKPCFGFSPVSVREQCCSAASYGKAGKRSSGGGLPCRQGMEEDAKRRWI